MARCPALPGANEYMAWETQPAAEAREVVEAARVARAQHLSESGGDHVDVHGGWNGGAVPGNAITLDAGFDGDTTELVEQLLLEQMGKAANVMQGSYYSEKLAVECAIPLEAGGNLSIMQDASMEQKGHGEAGGIVWKCAAAMAFHLCDRNYFEADFWTGKRCLEIGAGTGILGLAAARLGAAVTITDYGELSELISFNIRRNLSDEQAQRTRVDTLDWNNPETHKRFPPQSWDIILISDVVWADGYGRLPTLLTEIALPTTLIILGFEQRAHKRPELASPTFVPTLRKMFDITDVAFPAELQREHLFLFHLRNPRLIRPESSN